MAKTTRLAPQQLRALDRLTAFPVARQFYLAGASAITWHLGHRRSTDLDLFSLRGTVSLSKVEAAAANLEGAHLRYTTDAVVAFELDGVPIDMVKYPYALLEKPTPGPHGYPVAGRLDLAAMKLVAIARRGIARDFWDLYELLGSGIALGDAGRAYLERFGKAESDLYHVQRALTWFEDAETDPRKPIGLTPALWKRIKLFFERESPKLLDE